MGRKIAHALEALFLYLAVAFFWLLPTDWASDLGGWLGRHFGPRLGAARRARRHIALAFPDKSDQEVRAIDRAMWDNLGRVLGEYPHLNTIGDRSSGRVEVIGAQQAYDLRPPEGKGGILAGTHLANWEIMHVVASHHQVETTIVVRDPNNPWVSRLVDRLRGVKGGRRIPKGSFGAKEALKLLAEGQILGLTFDQKMNRGINLPFFGRLAMTPTAPAELAHRFGVPLIPIQVERMGAGRFRMTCHPALMFDPETERHAAIEKAMRQLNQHLEDWIRAKPGDWFWLHRRWPESTFKESTFRQSTFTASGTKKENGRIDP